MKSEEAKKPKVKFYLTSNPPRLINVWLKSSIARTVLSALGNVGLHKEAKEFEKEYNLKLNSIKGNYFSRTGIYEIPEPFYYGEFFELASKYVDIEMYRDFRLYTEDYDEDLRRQNLPTPGDKDRVELF